jgi:hypothetical protein
MKKCPRCGSRDIATILYGMPVFDDELRSKIDVGKLRLGGCCSGEPAPKYFCNGCGKGFAAPPIHIRGGRPEDYRKAVTAVRFSDGGFFGGMKKITIEKRGGKRVIAVFLPHAPDGELHQREFTDREWKSLLNKLFCDLYIHEWKKRRFCSDILDGEQWELSLRLSGGRKLDYLGSSDFPPLWEELKNVFAPYFKESDAAGPARMANRAVRSGEE